MPSFQTIRRVPFTPQQMFDLVADVEAYPQFVPMCEALRVLKKEEKPPAQILVANMTVGYKAIRESFSTRVTLMREDRTVLVEYLDGPFSHLENRWTFLETPTGTDVNFAITYEFRSVMLGLLMGALFDKAFRRFAEAFEARAHEVYGKPTPLVETSGA